jgi:hypothetical protein
LPLHVFGFARIDRENGGGHTNIFLHSIDLRRLFPKNEVSVG